MEWNVMAGEQKFIRAPAHAKAMGTGLSAHTPPQGPCCDGFSGVTAAIPGAVVTLPVLAHKCCKAKAVLCTLIYIVGKAG